MTPAEAPIIPHDVGRAVEGSAGLEVVLVTREEILVLRGQVRDAEDELGRVHGKLNALLGLVARRGLAAPGSESVRALVARAAGAPLCVTNLPRVPGPAL